MPLYDDQYSYWPLDEANGATRLDYQETKHLSDTNTVGQAAGHTSTAAEFVAANLEYLVNSNYAPALTDGLTVSCWIYFSALPSSPQTIAAWWLYGTDGSFAIKHTGADQLRVYILNAAGDLGSNHGTTGTLSLGTGAWYHIVVVYDGSLTGNANRLKIYVNGEAQTLTFTGTIPATVRNPSVPFELGRHNGWGDYYSGRIDHMRVLRRAWSAEEVAEEFGGGAGGETPDLLVDLVSYWKLDEASGQRNDSHVAFHLSDNNTVTAEAGKINDAALFASASSEYLSRAVFTPGLTNKFSLSLWVNFTSLPAGNYTLVNWWHYGTDGCFMIRYNASDIVTVFIVNPANDPGNNLGSMTDPIGAAIDTWYHLCVVYNGSGSTNADKLKMYWNAAEIPLTYAGTLPATVRNPSVPFTLSRFGIEPAGVDYLNGSLDEVAFWKRDLTGAEVTALYGAGNGLPYPFGAQAIAGAMAVMRAGTPTWSMRTSVGGARLVMRAGTPTLAPVRGGEYTTRIAPRTTVRTTRRRWR